VAAICRISLGMYIGVSALARPSIAFSAILEVIACCEAITLAEDLQINSCMVVFDCMEVIYTIKIQCMPRFSSVLREIKHCSESMVDVSFVQQIEWLMCMHIP
jgi:hypothetical protein